jgi:hypothetical protein
VPDPSAPDLNSDPLGYPGDHHAQRVRILAELLSAFLAQERIANDHPADEAEGLRRDADLLVVDDREARVIRR